MVLHRPGDLASVSIGPNVEVRERSSGITARPRPRHVRDGLTPIARGCASATTTRPWPRGRHAAGRPARATGRPACTAGCAAGGSSPERLFHEQAVTGDPENPRRYADDMVWRVRFRDRSDDDSDDAWLYLVLVLEFQAEVDFMMPLRIRNYVDNFHMEQWRGKAFGAASRLPPVLPIVLYNGTSPWSAAPRVIDLVTPGASRAGHGSSSVASPAAPLFAGDGYLILDMKRAGGGRFALGQRCGFAGCPGILFAGARGGADGGAIPPFGRAGARAVEGTDAAVGAAGVATAART